MPIPFTTQQRKDITRRQLRIDLENSSFANTTTQLNEQKAQLLNVDSANSAFYSFFRTQASAYELEYRAMLGSIANDYTDGTISPYTDGDLSIAAKSPGSTASIFFPQSPNYIYLIPKIVANLQGLNSIIGSDSRYEQNIISNGDVTAGINQVLNFLLNGITGSISASTNIIQNNFTGGTITVNDSANFTVGDYVYVTDNTHSGLYIVTGTTPFTPANPPTVPLPTYATISVNPVFPSASTIVVGGTVYNTVPGFTNIERTNGTSVLFLEILNNLTSRIISLIAEWLANVQVQITQLTIQNDDRSTQNVQNFSALVSANTAQSTIQAWQALPNFGTYPSVFGKFSDASLSPIQSELSLRYSAIPTRASQIITAVGSVVDTGNGTYGGDATSTYYNRYKWLDVRLNRASGSARRYFDTDMSIGFLATLSANNTQLSGDYSAYFITKQIVLNQGKSIIFVNDITNLNVGDVVTILSETQPEITRQITAFFGNNQIELDSAIPLTYLVSDTARLFKQL